MDSDDSENRLAQRSGMHYSIQETNALTGSIGLRTYQHTNLRAILSYFIVFVFLEGIDYLG